MVRQYARSSTGRGLRCCGGLTPAGSTPARDEGSGTAGPGCQQAVLEEVVAVTAAVVEVPLVGMWLSVACVLAAERHVVAQAPVPPCGAASHTDATGARRRLWLPPAQLPSGTAAASGAEPCEAALSITVATAVGAAWYAKPGEVGTPVLPLLRLLVVPLAVPPLLVALLPVLVLLVPLVVAALCTRAALPQATLLLQLSAAELLATVALKLLLTLALLPLAAGPQEDAEEYDVVEGGCEQATNTAAHPGPVATVPVPAPSASDASANTAFVYSRLSPVAGHSSSASSTAPATPCLAAQSSAPAASMCCCSPHPPAPPLASSALQRGWGAGGGTSSTRGCTRSSCGQGPAPGAIPPAPSACTHTPGPTQRARACACACAGWPQPVALRR